MTPQHRDLVEQKFSELESSEDVQVLGWAALYLEAASKLEEHDVCKAALDRLSGALREREKSLRKKALGGGARAHLGRHRKHG